MGITETLLIGIACALTQGSPETQKVYDTLSTDQKALIEYLQRQKICETLEQYSSQSSGEKHITGSSLLTSGPACISSRTPDQQ